MRGRSLFRALGIFVATVALLGAGALAWVKWAPRQVPEGQPALVTLTAGSLPAFREAFNAHEGDVRVLLMLSPT